MTEMQATGSCSANVQLSPYQYSGVQLAPSSGALVVSPFVHSRPELSYCCKTALHVQAATDWAQLTLRLDQLPVPECVKNKSKVPHSSHCCQPLLVHITCNLKGGPPDVEVSKGSPQPANLHTHNLTSRKRALCHAVASGRQKKRLHHAIQAKRHCGKHKRHRLLSWQHIFTRRTAAPLAQCNFQASNGTHLIFVLANASPQDRIHVYALLQHISGVLSDEVTQLQPQLVLGLALYGSEGVVIQHVGQPTSSLTPALLHA